MFGNLDFSFGFFYMEVKGKRCAFGKRENVYGPER